MPYLPSDIQDLLNSTISSWERLKIEDISLPLQEYVAMPRLMKDANTEEGSGQKCQWAVQTGLGTNYADTGLYAVESVNTSDVTTTAEIPWKFQYWAWAIDEREMAMNSGEPEKIFDLLKSKKLAEFNAAIQAAENRFWSKPTDTTDNLKWYGLYMYIVKNSTEGFTGTNPSGFTSGVGLNSSTYTSWANWSSQYVNVTAADFLKRARKAIDNTMFTAPMKTIPSVSDSPRREIYCGYSLKSDLEDMVESRNENLGKDLTYTNDDLAIRRIPIRWVPQLDSDTAYPFYGVDWGTFKFKFLKGWNQKESQEKAPYQTPVHTFKVHSGMNMICYNRRRNFVLYK